MDYISEAFDSKILAAALLSDHTIVTLSSHNAKSNIARQLTLITIDYAWKTFNVGQAIVFDNQVDSDLTEDELPTMVYKLSVIENADTVYFWSHQAKLSISSSGMSPAEVILQHRTVMLTQSFLGMGRTYKRCFILFAGFAWSFLFQLV